MRYIYLNDKFLEEENAKVSLYDSAITTGEMVTEVTRTYNHKLFYLENHVDRLLSGVDQLRFKINLSKEEIVEKSKQLIEKNVGSEGKNVEWQIVYIVSKGLEDHFKLFKNSEPTFAILCFPLKYRIGSMREKYVNGTKLLAVEQRAIPHELLPPQIKSRGRFHFKLAKLQVLAKDKHADAILLNKDDGITESTGANIYLIKDNTLYTAPTKYVVSGITRKYIINIAKNLGINVVEKCVPITDIGNYEEAFISSTIIGMVHVRQIEDHKYGNCECGPITTKIRNEFFKQVGVNFVEQAKEYAKDKDVIDMLK